MDIQLPFICSTKIVEFCFHWEMMILLFIKEDVNQKFVKMDILLLIEDTCFSSVRAASCKVGKIVSTLPFISIITGIPFFM